MLKNKLNKEIPLWSKFLFVLPAGLLLFLVVYKAIFLSFTYDESCTYLFFHKNSPWELFTVPEVWASVNNHILNTLLYQASSYLFGQSDFTIRLPNVLAFTGVLLITYKFSLTLLSSHWARLILLLILLINPYTLDFYSLCRGYGLSMFFHFTALYFFYRFIAFKESSGLYWGFGMLLFASLSLLTNFLLFPVYTFALWLCYAKDKPLRKHVLLAPILSGILTSILIALPLYYTSQTGEYGYGLGTIWGSFRSLLAGSTKVHVFYGDYILDILCVLFSLGLLFLLFRSFRRKENLFISISTLLLLLFIHILYYTLDIQFPTERKTTIYIPLFAVLAAKSIDSIKLNIFKKSVLSVISLLFLINFCSYFSMTSTVEWYFDLHTKKYILHLAQQKKHIKLQTHWLMQPTTSYYIETKKIDNIELIPCNRSFDINPNADVILGFNSDMKNNKNYQSLNPSDNIALFFKK